MAVYNSTRLAWLSRDPQTEGCDYTDTFSRIIKPIAICVVLKKSLVFFQIEGCDYSDTYSPVIKPTTICVVLTKVVSSNWPLQCLFAY